MREEEKKRMSQPSAIQKFFRKRWVFPAIYLVSAALILTSVLWFQANSNEDTNKVREGASPEGTAYSGDQPAVEVSKQFENLEMPVAEADSVVVQKQFYDDNAPTNEQEAALVFYNNTYHPNTGVDLALKDGSSFDVTAAASGTVIKAEKDPILGYVIEIDHEDGIVTHYQSLANVEVETGDTVEQGEVIAQAGQNLFNKEAKTHVHFEVRKDGAALNPNDFIGKPLMAIKQTESNQSAEQNQTTTSETEQPSTNSDEKQTDDKGQTEENGSEENSEQKKEEADTNADS